MGDLLWLALLALPFVLIWVVVVRPTQQRAKGAQELQESLQVGQRVMTSSGLFGVVEKLAEDTVSLRVADGVTLEFARRAIADVLPGSGRDTAE